MIVAGDFLLRPALCDEAKNELNCQPRAAYNRFADEHGGIGGDVFMTVHVRNLTTGGGRCQSRKSFDGYKFERRGTRYFRKWGVGPGRPGRVDHDPVPGQARGYDRFTRGPGLPEPPALILRAFDLELLGLGHYRMSTVRTRFDTKRKTHPAGEGVFVVRLTDLARFPHRTSRPSTNYKLQPFTLQHERDLASIAPLPFTLSYRARRPLYPLNLRVNEDGRTPSYGAGAGISVSNYSGRK